MSRLASFFLTGAILPPLAACLLYILGRGWAKIVYSGNEPESSIRWKKRGFKYSLLVFYAVFVVVGIVAALQHKF